jgi:amidase
MTVRRPSVAQVQTLAEGFGMTMDDAEAEVFRRMMEAPLAAYDLVDAMPDNLPEVRHPRTPGYRPTGEENRYNAWYVRTSIKGDVAEGPLAGKRVALKDCICLAGVPMSIGAGYLEGYVPDVDATVVTRILDAGGEIVGKATCEYLCLSGGSHTSWPAPVLNPWDTARSAGGSSSGSAVVVATGEADMALGGDQGGSIRIPAAWCGIVGLKPTYGLVPYTGIAGIELTVDHIGPMTANVRDNALLLEAIAGPDGLDPRQYGSKAMPYLATLEDGIEGLRIGVVNEGFGTPEAEPDVDEKVRAGAARLADLGATVKEVSVPIHDVARPIWTPTIVEGLVELMMRANGGGTNASGLYVNSFVDAHSRWRSHADELSVSLKVLMLVGEFMRKQYGGRFYGKSQNLVRKMRDSYEQALAKYDLLLMPTTPQKATRLPSADASPEDAWEAALNMNRNTAPFCATGHPAITVPCGLSEGLPVGLMLVGRHYDEATVYRVAYAFEQSGESATDVRHTQAGP